MRLIVTAWMLTWVALGSGLPARKKGPVAVPLAWPPSGQTQQLQYLESISSPADLSIRRGIFAKLGDILLGPSGRPQGLLRPFTIATDAQGRLLVADPGAAAVHVFEPARNKHKILRGPSRQPLKSPIGLDSDASGQIYVADSVLGMIFVFNSEGRFLRFIGNTRGEGLFKRPTGLAVDRASNRIYLTDTLRHKVYVLDPQGRVEREWGRRGEGPGDFNFPTAVALAGDRVFVLDAMNFRVQVFSHSGAFISSFGSPVNAPGGLLRPKALAVDAQHELVFVVDALFEVVQAFTFEGKLVLAFGHPGSGPGEFRLAAGICLRDDGQIFVADSYNRRIQVFRRLDKLAAAHGGW